MKPGNKLDKNEATTKKAKIRKDNYTADDINQLKQAIANQYAKKKNIDECNRLTSEAWEEIANLLNRTAVGLQKYYSKNKHILNPDLISKQENHGKRFTRVQKLLILILAKKYCGDLNKMTEDYKIHPYGGSRTQASIRYVFLRNKNNEMYKNKSIEALTLMLKQAIEESNEKNPASQKKLETSQEHLMFPIEKPICLSPCMFFTVVPQTDEREEKIPSIPEGGEALVTKICNKKDSLSYLNHSKDSLFKKPSTTNDPKHNPNYTSTLPNGLI